MTPLDRVLQEWRIVRAMRHVPRGARVLDIGAHKGELLRRLGRRISYGVGIDPESDDVGLTNGVEMFRGLFPDERVQKRGPYDVVTMLAVFEHVPDPLEFSKQVASVLVPNGRFVITVPDARVDDILDVLVKLKLVDGMALEEHHGFDAKETPSILRAAGFDVVKHERFQLGLNNVYLAIKR